MPYLTAIITSLISLGAISAIYGCRRFSRPGSWMRGELIDMILISLLAGFFPLALTASVMGIWGTLDDLSTGFSLSALQSAGLDVLGLVFVLLTLVIFVAAARTRTGESSLDAKAGISLNPNQVPIG